MKKTRGFGLFGIIVIIIITALVSSIATGVIMLNNNSIGLNGNSVDLSNDKDLQEFIEVYETLITKYYEDIDKEGLLDAAKDGMSEYLGDKYTTYLDDSEYDKILDELSGTYSGIGISINNNNIVSVTPLSPADKAGILAGDTILTINGTNVQTMDSDSIGALIKGNSSKIVNIQVSRNNEKYNYTLEKKELINPTVTHAKLDGTSIGYIYIKSFSQNLGTQVSNALKGLESKGINSLIIDVRDNAGGYLSAAEETASLFLEENKIIYSLKTSNSKFTYSDETEEKRTYPIVVLMNNNSASASEILAAALKDSYGATLVGSKSYGKGKVQQVVDSFKFTSAEWLTPGGICIDGIGLSPDYNVIYSDTETYDTQINKAIELLQ